MFRTQKKQRRMRGAAAWLELPQNPHPTRLRRATLSHEWEREGTPYLSMSSPSASDPELAASETSIARPGRSIAIQAIAKPSATTTSASSVSTEGQ